MLTPEDCQHMLTRHGAARWLDPLVPAFPELTTQDAVTLGQFEDALRGLLSTHPVSRPVDASERSRNLREIQVAPQRAGQRVLRVGAAQEVGRERRDDLLLEERVLVPVGLPGVAAHRHVHPGRHQQERRGQGKAQFARVQQGGERQSAAS
jgi:hypothetical protein